MMATSSLIKNFRLRIETEDPVYYGQKKLKVRGRDLAHLSEAVFQLLELEVLDLSPEREACLDYRLPSVPPSIGRLINLRVLMLDTNDLETIPPEIALLQQLERLSLSNNRLSSLPGEFRNLRNMVSLHLANNEFSHFPEELCELTELQFLDLSDNHIASLPDSISKLTNLETLLLFINELGKLPDSICQLTELSCLWVGKNHLRYLPRHFGKLRRLDWGARYTSSALDGNPLVRHPLEICRMGPDAIERYMASTEANQSRRRSEGKDHDVVNGEEEHLNGY